MTYQLRLTRLRSEGPGLGDHENRKVELERTFDDNIPIESATRELALDISKAHLIAADQEAETERQINEQYERRQILENERAQLRQLQQMKKDAEDKARQCAAAIMQLTERMDVQAGQDPGAPEKTP